MTCTRQSPCPTDSRTKLPSSNGPDSPSVRNEAFSSAACIQVVITAVSSLAKEYVALTGSGPVSPAIVDPGKIGKPAGTPSQIRPQAVSVWVSAAGLSAGALGVSADALGAPDAAGLGAAVGPPDGEGPAL